MGRNPIMTTRELAEYIKLNEKTVIRMAQYGKIPGVKIGNQWRFHLAAIDRYLQNDLLESSDSDLDSIIATKEDIIPLSRLTGPDLIDIGASVKTGEQALSTLSDIAHASGATPDKDVLLKELKQRERMLSTAVGGGVAFPHPRHPSVKLFKEPKLIIMRSRAGVEFDAPDGGPVNVFFMPCAPNEFIHIRTLAKISKMLHVPGTVESFKSVKTKDQILRLVMEFDRKYLFPGRESRG